MSMRSCSVVEAKTTLAYEGGGLAQSTPPAQLEPAEKPLPPTTPPSQAVPTSRDVPLPTAASELHVELSPDAPQSTTASPPT
eukprot:scaffold84197_cov60-Phaeocystis_antarctica.AAC.1